MVHSQTPAEEQGNLPTQTPISGDPRQCMMASYNACPVQDCNITKVAAVTTRYYHNCRLNYKPVVITLKQQKIHYLQIGFSTRSNTYFGEWAR